MKLTAKQFIEKHVKSCGKKGAKPYLLQQAMMNRGWYWSESTLTRQLRANPNIIAKRPKNNKGAWTYHFVGNV